MLAECSMDHATIEQDLGCVGDGVEGFERGVEFGAVVVGESGDPGLDLLCAM